MKYTYTLPTAILSLALISSPSVYSQTAGFSSSTEEVKVSASTSKEKVDDRQTVEETLLSTSFKSNGKKYLYKVDFNAECEIRRFSIGSGSDTGNNSELVAAVRVWALVDGQVLPIASNEAAERDNILNLCGQLEWDEASRGNRDDLTSTTGFSWVVNNIAKGNHQLEIKAELIAAARSGPQAGNGTMARVGKRIVTVNQFR
jgi:hypothetical protein